MATRTWADPFLWGEGGARLSPEDVARRQAEASDRVRRGADYSPVGHWTQGLARMSDSIIGALMDRSAGAAKTAGYAEADAEMARRFPGLYGSAGSSSPVAAALAGDGSDFMSRLVSSESGGNWNALNSEGYGGRLQFGDARLADAAAAGLVPEGTTGAAFSRMSPEVQQAVENWHFADIDRQAASRGLDQYVGKNVGGVPITQDAIRGMAHLGGIGGAAQFLASGGQYNPADSNGTSLRDYASRMGGGGVPAALASGPSSADITAAMANPWVAQKYGPVLQALAGQAGQREQAIFAQQLAQSDPMYQAQLAQLTAPAPAPKPIEVGGVLLDGSTYQPIFDSRSNNGGFDPDRYRVVGNTLFDLAAEGGPSPVGDGTGTEEVIFGPDGNPIMVRGSAGAAKSFTEAQSKDVGFATRMRGAEDQLAPVESALTSIGDRVLGADPTGIARGALQSEEYQRARQAGQTWLLAFLRKDSGAATTKEEDRMYGETFLPQPGDGPAVIEQKRMGRDLAMRAVEAGMSPQQALAQVRALGGAQGGEAQPQGQQGATPQRRRFNPQTGAFE